MTKSVKYYIIYYKKLKLGNQVQISLITSGGIGKISVWADGSQGNRIQAVMYLLPVLVDGFHIISILKKKMEVVIL